MKPTSGTYSPQLDHLRFFAAMLVFFWHSLHSKGLLDATYAPDIKLFSWLEEGHTGVSLFMVLSGYLLFRIMEGKRIDLVPFYKNRFLRLVPLVVFWAVWLIDLKARTLSDILLSFIPIGTSTQGVDGFWSISVELGFYLLVPLLIAQLRNYDDENVRKAGFKKLSCLILLIVFSMIFRSLAAFRGEDAKILSYLSIFGRITEFLFGGLILVVDKYFQPKMAVKACLFIFSAIVFVLFMDKFNRLGGYYGLAGGSFTYDVIWTSMNAVAGLFYGSLILLYTDDKFKSSGRVSRLMAFGGAISYSIYLNHFFTLNVIHALRAKYYGVNPLSVADALYLYVICALVLTLAFSTMTYYIVEKPFLKKKRLYILNDAAA